MENTARRLLIVEDEVRIGQLIRRLIHFDELNLECLGTAENGKDGLDMILREHPDIVITDIRMPKINGLDLIEMVRRQLPEVRFIVLSGYKEFEYAHRALQYEVDGYLLKPINEAELNEVLHRVVGVLDEKNNEAFEKRRMQQEVKESRQIIRRDFLRTIIEQEECGELEAFPEGIAITSTFGGNASYAFAHLLAPLKEQREAALLFLKRACDLSIELGCDVMGTPPGALDYEDARDPSGGGSGVRGDPV